MKDQLESVVLQMYKAGMRCSEAVGDSDQQGDAAVGEPRCGLSREFQKAFIFAVLKDQRGNQCRAAERLGIHRNTLRRTIRGLEIDIGATRAIGKRRPARSEVPISLRRRAT